MLIIQQFIYSILVAWKISFQNLFFRLSSQRAFIYFDSKRCSVARLDRAQQSMERGHEEEARVHE